MSPLVWYIASLVVLVFWAGWKLGRASGLLDGYEQGHDDGRSAKVDDLVDAALQVRRVRLVDPPPFDWAEADQ